MEIVRTNGLEIAYECVGEGPPLVFVHGGAADSRAWRPQLAALADEFTVVAWDEPGAGRSSDVPPDFGLADYANCLAALIEALELGPAHVAGISWGGTVALELYRRHPELVATLILADTYAGWKGSLPEEEVRARVAGVLPASMRLRQDADPHFPGWFAGDPPAEFVPLLDEMAADVRPDSLRPALAIMAEADQRDLLPRIAVPTLLLWGELDVALAAQHRPPVRAGDPGHDAGRDPGRWPRQQPRAARAVQPRRARVLSRPPAPVSVRPHSASSAVARTLRRDASFPTTRSSSGWPSASTSRADETA